MVLTENKRAELLKLPTGNVADSAGRNSVMDSGIKPIDPRSRMIGRAVTAECFPGDNLALHQGMEAAEAGDVLVFDLKGFTDRYYSKVLGGDRRQVMAFIEAAAAICHVELTTLVVPDENDSETEIRELSRWVSRLKNPDGEEIPLHLSRFFPRFHMQDRKATDVRTIYRLAEIARENLNYVYPGNC